jgi:glyoxylase-like metal-dependent hydrolase (beta-lactamase superfamily II)
MIDSIVVGAIATNCYVVPFSDGGRTSAVVIDPGGDADAIISRLRRHRFAPSLIVLTHGHFDHLAGLPPLLARIAEAGWDAPPVAIHSADSRYLGAAARAAHSSDFRRVGALSYVDELWEDMPEPSRLIADGDRIGPFTVMHTPGHTPGSLCLYDEAEGFLFSGDTLFSRGVGRTDLIGGDGEALARSLDRLLALPDRVRVFPGHGSQTRIADERW